MYFQSQIWSMLHFIFCAKYQGKAYSIFPLLLLAALFFSCHSSLPFSSHPDAMETTLEVTAIGKAYHPESNRLAAYQPEANMGGSTSVRNHAKQFLEWKPQGYYQRNRDLGQVFSVERDCSLDAVVLRTGPSDKAVLENTPGARVFIQFFEVEGNPVIDNMGTPQGTKASHGFSDNHRCDDVVTGVHYKSIMVAKGGLFPAIPPTFANNRAVNGDAGKLNYMRWKLGGRPLLLKAGKRYAYLVGLETPGNEAGFALANANYAGIDAPPALNDQFDYYPSGWGIRREGDGTLPPTMAPGPQPPAGEKQQELFKEALFADGAARYSLLPVTDGFPDVDTYRDLNFALEVKWR